MSDSFLPISCLSAGAADSENASLQALPHVLLVIDGFPKALGGGERVVLRLAALLPQYGYRVSILTFALDPRSEFQLDNAPCPVYLLPLTKTYDWLAWRGAFALRRLIRQQDVAIVQTFFESADLWAGVFAKLLTPAKVIWSRRDMGILRGRKHAQAYRALRRLPDAVFAVSEQVRLHAIAQDGIAPERVHTIHNGLDLAAAPRDRNLLSGGPAVVTAVGNIRHVKGHDILIRAAARVLEVFPETQFTVAGEILESNYYEELTRLIAELTLETHFHFLGRIADLPAHLRSSDIFVLPSRSEGFSNALVEAMANGLPVVATTVGGNAEAIDEGVSGSLVPAEDAEALAEAILELLKSPDRAQTMGRRGKIAAESRFTADAMLRKTATIYSALLGTR